MSAESVEEEIQEMEDALSQLSDEEMKDIPSLFNLTVDLLANASYPLPPEDFVPRVYKQIDLTDDMHKSPRYGNTNDMVLYFVGTEEEVQSYKAGVYGNAVLIWCILFIWGGLLVALKWTKPQKLGWLAGIPPRRPDFPVKKEVMGSLGLKAEEVKQNQNQNDNGNKGRSRSVNSIVGVVGDCKEAVECGAVQDACYVDDVASGTSAENCEMYSESPVREDKHYPGMSVSDSVRIIDCIDSVKDDALRADDKPPPVSREEEGGEEEAIIAWRDEVRKCERRMRICRRTVVVCGVLVLVFTGLLTRFGFYYLDKTMDSALETVPALQQAVEFAANATEHFLYEANQLRRTRNLFIGYLGTCEFNFTNATDTNLTSEEIAKELNRILNYTHDLGYNFTEAIHDEFYGISQDLLSIENTVGTLHSFWVYVAYSFALVLALVDIVFVVGVVLAWRKQQPRLFRDCSSRIALPVFIFLLLGVVVMMPLALMTSQAMGDLCINTPDDQILGILNAQDPFDVLAEYYLRGCDPELIPQAYVELLWEVFRALESINDFLLDFINNIDRGNGVVCEKHELVLLAATIIYQRYLSAFIETIRDVLQALGCYNFNGLYTDIAYETVCYHGLRGIAQIFIYLFVVTFCCMIMITLRIAWFEVEGDAHVQVRVPHELESSGDDRTRGECFTRLSDDAETMFEKDDVGGSASAGGVVKPISTYKVLGRSVPPILLFKYFTREK